MRFSKLMKEINNNEDYSGIIEQRVNELISLTNPAKYEKINQGEIVPKLSCAMSYKRFLTPEQLVNIESGFFDERYITFDDTKGIYNSLLGNLKNKEINSFEDLLKIVTKTTFDYIGGAYCKGTMEDRFSLLPSYDFVNDIDVFNGKISDFKDKKFAMCVERAMIMHQLCKFLGLDSEMIYTKVNIDGKKTIHAINRITFKGQTYLIDASLIDNKMFDKNGMYNPIIAIASKGENLDKLQNLPERTIENDEGKIRVIEYNPTNEEEFKVDANEKTSDFEF